MELSIVCTPFGRRAIRAAPVGLPCTSSTRAAGLKTRFPIFNFAAPLRLTPSNAGQHLPQPELHAIIFSQLLSVAPHMQWTETTATAGASLSGRLHGNAPAALLYLTAPPNAGGLFELRRCARTLNKPACGLAARTGQPMLTWGEGLLMTTSCWRHVVYKASSSWARERVLKGAWVALTRARLGPLQQRRRVTFGKERGDVANA